MNQIAIAHCPQCNEMMPVNMPTYRHQDKPDLRVTVIYCAACEIVLNIDSVPDVQFVEESWLAEHGWTIDGQPPEVSQ